MIFCDSIYYLKTIKILLKISENLQTFCQIRKKNYNYIPYYEDLFIHIIIKRNTLLKTIVT